MTTLGYRDISPKTGDFCLQELGKDLPVGVVIPDLIRALASEKRAVLQAPPGAGKTTFVPLALLAQPWLTGKKIVMLEPRRLAAKACAAHMAGMLGEQPGQTVGYQIRMERRIGPDTRIEVITEGILTRRIQADPSLKGVGLVIFDEFHERHIHSDLGLAFCLEAAEVFNEDLRILVMSATMDTAVMSTLMEDAPILSSQGRTYPVVTHYLPPEAATTAGRNLYQGQDRYRGVRSACMLAIEKGLSQESGDILVFLPGVREIRNLAQALESLLPLNQPGQPGQPGQPCPKISILPLYGNLSRADQAAAIVPSLPGRRKIVLATAIAETSLTIEGVRVVVDTGLMRVPRFSPGTGMGQLDTILVSRASADQRRGRAGRTGPGICYRIWSEHQTQGLIPFNRPEIISADLTSLVLELAQWGVSDPKVLKWLDPPPETSFSHAKALLTKLKGLDPHGRITPHGRRLLSAGVHPRLAHMILRADQMGQGRLACWLAALLGERDIFWGSFDPDIRLRLEALASLSSGRFSSRSSKALTQDSVTGFNESLARTILKNAAKIEKDLKINSTGTNADLSGSVLAFAWPGRVAKKRNNKEDSFLMASGSGAFFRSANSLSFLSYIVAVHLDGNPRNAGIFLAAPYSKKDLEQDFKGQIKIREECVWNKQTRSVQAVLKRCYGKLVIQETMVKTPNTEAVRAGMIQGIRETGLDILPWTKKLRHFQERAVFLKKCGHFPGLPDLSERVLLENLSQWLGPFLDHVHSAAGLKQVDLSSALTGLLTWEEQQTLHTHAPTHVTVPSGSRVSLQYLDDNGLLESPILAVRLQEMFGLTKSPSIARGKILITLHLLSPAGRPVQITKDLESFWKNTYRAVKKDLMGRYPKHYWPENPFSAEPTNRVKPR